jgi:hypothetical protein
MAHVQAYSEPIQNKNNFHREQFSMKGMSVLYGAQLLYVGKNFQLLQA